MLRWEAFMLSLLLGAAVGWGWYLFMPLMLRPARHDEATVKIFARRIAFVFAFIPPVLLLLAVEPRPRVGLTWRVNLIRRASRWLR